MQEFHTSTFGNEPILHDHPQKFGSLVKRFRDPNEEKNLAKPGPGQYLSQNMLPKFVPMKGKEESAPFLGPSRNSATQFKDREQSSMPGPQDYGLDHTKAASAAKHNKGTKHPFQFNEKRFLTNDKRIPGVGQYNLPDAIEIKNPKQPMPSYKSNQERTLDLVIGRENPGVGEYDT